MLPISPRRSEFLNLVRWASAGLVLVGHAEMTSVMLLGDAVDRSNALFTYVSSHSHIAVMFFFVLSGYLIGYAVHRREAAGGGYGFRAYFLDRWSRIYSVLLVAILLTLVFDRIGAALSASYANPVHYPQDAFIVRLLVNLLSVQGALGHRVQLGSNPALWSIGYEFCYYIAFGLIHFRHALFRRRATFAATLLAMALLGGAHMTAYFAIWMTGYWAFRLHHVQGIRFNAAYAVPLAVAIGLANHYLAYRHVLAWPEFCTDALIALLFGGMLLCDFKGGPLLPRANAWLADFSYSVYAFHMPIMFFWYAVVPGSVHRSLSAVESGLLLMLVCIVSARLLYHVSEARRRWFRTLADRVLLWGVALVRPGTARS
jgi:peptidoglycan/LPS O-acetylase OafA/YrhL